MWVRYRFSLFVSCIVSFVLVDIAFVEPTKTAQGQTGIGYSCQPLDSSAFWQAYLSLQVTCVCDAMHVYHEMSLLWQAYKIL